MKYTHTKDYYLSKYKNTNKKFRYRLDYCGGCIYQLTFHKYKVIYKCCSLYSMHQFLIENKIPFDEVHLPYMTYQDLLNDFVTFGRDK